MMPAWVLSFGCGFLSLSFEILWVRFFSFSAQSLPQSFAFVLMFYLIGISAGAYIGKIDCHRYKNLWRVSGIYLLLAAVIAMLGPWVAVYFTPRTVNFVSVVIICITLTAGLIACVFPIAHHLGTPANADKIGRSLSHVYVANIMGATLGPIITGIVLLAYFTTQQTWMICGACTGVLAIACLLQGGWRIGVTCLWLLILSLPALIYQGADSHFIIAKSASHHAIIRKIIENEYGIIVSYFQTKNSDEIWGGNVYDGNTNLDPVIDSNYLERLLILPAIQPHPKRVLMIGLSVGTWLTLTNTFPNVEHIDVVETNPGYLQLIDDYPIQKRALHDPRVHLYFDDARRWLKAHQNTHYDMVIMNTTYHWRAYSSNLLAQEFLRMIKHTMNPGAVFAYNATGSMDALKTATTVFSSAYLYNNFVIAADFDWRPTLHTPDAAHILESLMLEGKPLFPKEHQDLIPLLLNHPVYTVQEMQTQDTTHVFEVVTDRNLLPEYKYGIPLVKFK